MFEAAIPFANSRYQENITLHRRRFAEKTDLPRANALEIGGQPLDVAVVASGDGNVMSDAAGHEAGEGEGAHFDRVVDQFVVTGGAIDAKPMTFGRTRFAACRFERGGYPPTGE